MVDRPVAEAAPASAARTWRQASDTPRVAPSSRSTASTWVTTSSSRAPPGLPNRSFRHASREVELTGRITLTRVRAPIYRAQAGRGGLGGPVPAHRKDRDRRYVRRVARPRRGTRTARGREGADRGARRRFRLPRPDAPRGTGRGPAVPPAGQHGVRPDRGRQRRPVHGDGTDRRTVPGRAAADRPAALAAGHRDLCRGGRWPGRRPRGRTGT